MDPKTKRKYIIMLGAAVLFAVAFVLWTQSSVPEVEPVATPSASSPTPAAQPARSGADMVYTPPAVFPQNTSFDALVIGQLKTFQNFQPSKLSEGELGRENPFNNY